MARTRSACVWVWGETAAEIRRKPDESPGVFPLTYLVLDGHFGNHNAVQMAR